MKFPRDIALFRIRNLISGFAVMLCLGISLAWSLFVAPLEAYFGWTRANTSIIFTLSLLSFPLGGIVTSILVRKGFRFYIIFLLACILSSTGFLLSTLITHVAQLAVTYGVFCGIATGMAYTSIISILPLWFPEKHATVTGFLLMGYALSGSVIGLIVAALINRFGWKSAFYFLGMTSFLALAAAAFLISPPNGRQTQQLPKRKESSLSEKHTNPDVSSSQLVKTPAFWIYMLTAIFLTCCGMTVINHVSPIFTEALDSSLFFATIMVSVVSVTNGLSRFCFGFIWDRIGPYRTVKLIGILYFTAVIIMFIAMNFRSQWLFIPGTCFALLGFGGISSTTPGYVRAIYGEKYFTQNYAIFNLSGLLPPFLGPMLIGGIRTATGSYLPGFVILIVFCTIGFILSQTLKKVASLESKPIQTLPKKPH